ncbi:hypothetical protein [Brumimicrobium sp.]|uniref:hypothetical protein n=1 Tax=Brumimicrobium sp. TaxID=2029867 RepID=UPI003A91D83D
METIKDISMYLILSIVATVFCYWLESSFLFDYLQNNIIGLLITLLAINTATSGLVASKMQDLKLQKPQIDLKEPIKQMKLSLVEQIILIAVSIIFMTILNSSLVNFDYKEHLFNGGLIFVLIYALAILMDTGKAVFTMIEGLQNIDK